VEQDSRLGRRDPIRTLDDGVFFGTVRVRKLLFNAEFGAQITNVKVEKLATSICVECPNLAALLFERVVEQPDECRNVDLGLVFLRHGKGPLVASRFVDDE
jgi:hypothetical protein